MVCGRLPTRNSKTTVTSEENRDRLVSATEILINRTKRNIQEIDNEITRLNHKGHVVQKALEFARTEHKNAQVEKFDKRVAAIHAKHRKKIRKIEEQSASRSKPSTAPPTSTAEKTAKACRQHQGKLRRAQTQQGLHPHKKAQSCDKAAADAHNHLSEQLEALQQRKKIYEEIKQGAEEWHRQLNGQSSANRSALE